jgi:MATE family multidrug resistance protein
MNFSHTEFAVEAKQLLKLGVPMVATQLFIMGMGFVDTVMAGRYSSVDLAGVTMGGNVLWPLFMFSSGLTMALTPIVAQLRGASRLEDIGEKARQGLWIAFVMSFVTIALMLNAEPFFIWLQVDQQVITISMGYLKACAWGVPPVMIYVSLRFVAEGLGRTKPPMMIAAGALVINIPVNYIFIYGEFGVPELGGVGCGVATATVYWFELIAMIFVLRMRFFRQTKLLDRFSWPNISGIREILKIGLPIGAQSFVGMMVFSVVGFMVAGIGITELAAHSIAGNLNWLTYVIPMALGSAVSIRVGFACGAFDPLAVRRIIKTVYQVTLCYAVIVSCLLILARFALVSLYTRDPSVIALAATLMLFVAFYQIFDDLQAVTNGVLRGFKDTVIPMLVTLISYWFIALPLGYLLANGLLFNASMGVYGYWAGLTFGLFLAAGATGTRLYFTTRVKLNELVKGELNFDRR